MSKIALSWADRFALIEHFKPTEEQICNAFGITGDELAVANSMRAAGTFKASTTLDVAKYASVFTADGGPSVATVAPTATAGTGKNKVSGATTFARPESASKKAKVPQKRGRKGDKIAVALASVPTTQVPVETFMQQHGVSLAVLRQSKRFLSKMPAEQAAQIGKICVRQDKGSKQLMIWREVASA